MTIPAIMAPKKMIVGNPPISNAAMAGPRHNQLRLSRELGKLREHDILGTRRESKSIFYHLKDNRIRAIVDTLCHVMMTEGNKREAENGEYQIPSLGS